MSWWLKFEYDQKGRGDLIAECSADPRQTKWPARTGSINELGHLVNAITPTLWYILKPPVATEELGMVIHPGEGWKARLYLPVNIDEYRWTHFLIHPDGSTKGKPGDGTEGCIGTRESALELRDLITMILERQESLSVRVTKKDK